MKSKGKPDAGNPPVRFDEGEGLDPSLLYCQIEFELHLPNSFKGFFLEYSLIYSRTSRDQARSLHPLIKPYIRARIAALRENPYLGKNLQRELSGYYSLRVKRHRIIYKIKASNYQIEIHFIGHRKDIYQLFREKVEKEL